MPPCLSAHFHEHIKSVLITGFKSPPGLAGVTGLIFMDPFKTDLENFGNHMRTRSHGVFSANHARSAHLRIL